LRFASQKDGDRWVGDVWTEYADSAGETVAEVTPRWCRPGSGRDAGVVYMPFDIDGMVVDGICEAQFDAVVGVLYDEGTGRTETGGS
jgi:hypothetical protein